MSTDQLKHIDLENPEFLTAWEMIRKTQRSVFLTGKAGTGKSTFLRYICANTTKKHVVLAPTGIAAVNVGGQTLHSFFKIPFKPLLPDDPDFSPRQLRKTLRYNRKKVRLIQELDLIIIDEISMVRADIIDFIDKVLRTYCANMREPFGGKQLLFVGDVFQLEPVVTRDMREILSRYYNQFFFFNAHVFNDLGLIPIELRKIYRQTDNSFVSMLDRVRVNRATGNDMQMINSRYNPNYTDGDGFVMTLATRRDTVDTINETHMNALKTPEYTFMGEIDGTYPDNDLPTLKELTLKEGAQVIFVRNDPEGRWVNGSIGRVSEVNENTIKVELENGEEYSINQEQWDNIQYSYDEKEKRVIENLVGTFKQYPIKPAWALTVHKSQGLTFNNVVIDLAGGAFSGGQTYVALSRCTSLEGITLLKPIAERDIIVNRYVTEFSQQFNNQATINNAFEQERAAQLYRRAIHAFDHSEFREAVQLFAQGLELHNTIKQPAVQRLIAAKMHRFTRLNKQIQQQQEIIDAQNRMLRELAQEYTMMGHQALGYGELAGEEQEAYGGKKAVRHDPIAIKSALANFNKALRISPDFTDAMIGKARLLATIDQTDEAEDLYRKVLKTNKNNYEAHMGLYEIYIDENDIPAAIKSLKRAIKADKYAVTPLLALADIFESIDLDDLAEEYREAAKKLHIQKQKRQAKRRRKKRGDE